MRISTAENILDYLTKGPQTIIGDTSFVVIYREPEPVTKDLFSENMGEDKKQIYTYKPGITHFLIVAVESNFINPNQIKFNLSNFNVDFYAMFDFNISSLIFESNYQLITVKSFKNRNQGMNYYETVTYNLDYVMEDCDPTYYRVFIISSENYKILYENKNIGLYYKFFKDNYISN